MRNAESQISRAQKHARSVVLVVDDERGPRESLHMILSRSHEVVTADCGAAALEVLRNRPVDLATVDLHMPGINGNELIKIMRNEFPTTQIVVITGFAALQNAVGDLRNSVAAVLGKPFEVEEVETAVGKALDRQRKRRNLAHILAHNAGGALNPDVIINALPNDARPNGESCP